ncbi:DUF4224 domain-containing protein [Halofilum ochraceum]|uniref:DUF4224 domain-containing protein n=1 Tax=Halofilum ochraceum TaxID=1611323 RepID=UPI0008DB1E14|nr:DUF4224 domain-containing protein [Halofilum ochraceum]
MNPYLTQEEIESLTGKERPGAQCQALAYMGFVFVVRPDGKPRVLRAHHDRLLGIDDTGAGRNKEPEPDWSALDG